MGTLQKVSPKTCTKHKCGSYQGLCRGGAHHYLEMPSPSIEIQDPEKLVSKLAVQTVCSGVEIIALTGTGSTIGPLALSGLKLSAGSDSLQLETGERVSRAQC